MNESAFDRTKAILAEIELINGICLATCGKGCAIRTHTQELCLDLPAVVTADAFSDPVHDFLTSRGWWFHNDSNQWNLSLG